MKAAKRRVRQWRSRRAEDATIEKMDFLRDGRLLLDLKLADGTKARAFFGSIGGEPDMDRLFVLYARPGDIVEVRRSQVTPVLPVGRKPRGRR